LLSATRSFAFIEDEEELDDKNSKPATAFSAKLNSIGYETPIIARIARTEVNLDKAG